MKITKKDFFYFFTILRMVESDKRDNDDKNKDCFFSFDFSNVLTRGINEFLTKNQTNCEGLYSIYHFYDDGTFRIRFDRNILKEIFNRDFRKIAESVELYNGNIDDVLKRVNSL